MCNFLFLCYRRSGMDFRINQRPWLSIRYKGSWPSVLNQALYECILLSLVYVCIVMYYIQCTYQTSTATRTLRRLRNTHRYHPIYGTLNHDDDPSQSCIQIVCTYKTIGWFVQTLVIVRVRVYIHSLIDTTRRVRRVF